MKLERLSIRFPAELRTAPMKWLSSTERLHTLSISACLPTGIPNSVWAKLKTLEILDSRDTAIRVQEELEILRLCTILETYSPQGTITLGVPVTLQAVSMEHLKTLVDLTLSMPGEHVIDMTALGEQVVRMSSHEWERYTAEIKSRHNTAGIDKLVEFLAGTQLQSLTVFLRLDQSRKNLDAIAEEWKAEFKATMEEKAQSTVQRFNISTVNFARDSGILR
ncbi:hypothetical protein C8J56DRAFT_900073 [Mycena floridula]|nr:hypothetical protein C8J56DRAFT_900073 [Mycena floridula]